MQERNLDAQLHFSCSGCAPPSVLEPLSSVEVLQPYACDARVQVVGMPFEFCGTVALHTYTLAAPAGEQQG
jgi:hypothetical protein